MNQYQRLIDNLTKLNLNNMGIIGRKSMTVKSASVRHY